MSHPHLEQAELRFKARRFEVLELDVPTRDGQTRQYHIVEPNDAVVILPLLDREHVVMIRNKRHGVGKDLWELPAGTLEPGEDPQPCAERELIEETGYRAAQVTPLLSFYSCPGFCTERLHAFVAEQLSEAEQNLDETEHIEPKVMTLDEAYAMVRDNRIEDGKTIATLLYHRCFMTQ